MIIHIVLLILKIIGIVLAVLIGLVLLLLCLALFVPVRYRIRASRSEGEEEPPFRIKGRVSWIFPLFQIKLLYPADVYLKAKVLFFTIFRMPAKENNNKSDGKTSKERKKAKKKDSDEKKNSPDQEKEPVQIGPELQEKSEKVSEGSETTGTVEKTAADAETEPAPETINNEKRNIIERIKDVFSEIRQFFQKIRYTIESLCDKIKEVRENITYYTELIQSDMFLQAFGSCKEELISILAYISPKKLEADLIVGMGDPAATGQVLAVYGILYPLVGNHVRVSGDFEQKRIEGTLFIKGRLALFRFVKAACRIYFNKDIRKLIKILKKEDA